MIAWTSTSVRTTPGATAVSLMLVGAWTSTAAQESRFATSDSLSPRVHLIELYDADGVQINPTADNARPYSPMKTCGKCHDHDAVSHGFHFNELSGQTTTGRRGEPWMWVDPRSGTQIPLSYRGWEGTYDPRDLGIPPRDFLLQFGRHFPGGGPGRLSGSAGEGASQTDGQPEDAAEDNVQATARAELSGDLEIDCMICHSRDHRYNPEVRWAQIQDENFAWAATSAIGLAEIEGSVKRLPEDFDPGAEGAVEKLPRTLYANDRFNHQNQVFFDVIRTPPNSNCFYCHTTRGIDERPDWMHGRDVHSGLSCVDCHRNGIDHHITRGYPGEENPSGVDVRVLSCAGCHLREDEYENFTSGPGAPMPEHMGLPPLHFEKLTCTACHSGPRPAMSVGQVQTSLAHRLGLPEHDRSNEMSPGIVAPVLMPVGGKLTPHRLVWPSFWGVQRDDEIMPLNPEEAFSAVRRALRVRRDFSAELSTVRLGKDDRVTVLGELRAAVADDELSDEEREALGGFERERAAEAFREKLTASLADLQKSLGENGGQAVLVSGGRAYRLDASASVEEFEAPAAAAYAWPMAHNVRPASESTGITGCRECHAGETPFFNGLVTALGPAPTSDSPQQVMAEYQGIDRDKLELWNQSFAARTPFKVFGFLSMTVVGSILILYLLVGLNGLLNLFRRSGVSQGSRSR